MYTTSDNVIVDPQATSRQRTSELTHVPVGLKGFDDDDAVAFAAAVAVAEVTVALIEAAPTDRWSNSPRASGC